MFLTTQSVVTKSVKEENWIKLCLENVVRYLIFVKIVGDFLEKFEERQ